MSQPGPEPPSRAGFFAEILRLILGYIDKPWKAVVVVVLIILVGGGWIVYSKGDQILQAWLAPDQPQLRASAVPEALKKLTDETTADLVQVWSVDLASNSQWFVGARRHDGERPAIP